MASPASATPSPLLNVPMEALRGPVGEAQYCHWVYESRQYRRSCASEWWRRWVRRLWPSSSKRSGVSARPAPPAEGPEGWAPRRRTLGEHHDVVGLARPSADRQPLTPSQASCAHLAWPWPASHPAQVSSPRPVSRSAPRPFATPCLCRATPRRCCPVFPSPPSSVLHVVAAARVVMGGSGNSSAA